MAVFVVEIGNLRATNLKRVTEVKHYFIELPNVFFWLFSCSVLLSGWAVPEAVPTARPGVIMMSKHHKTGRKEKRQGVKKRRTNRKWCRVPESSVVKVCSVVRMKGADYQQRGSERRKLCCPVTYCITCSVSIIMLICTLLFNMYCDYLLAQQ